MTYKEFRDKFKKQVEALPFDVLLAFGISISKKLYPDYELFSKEEQWGDSSILSKAIALCEKAKVEQIEEGRLREMSDMLEGVTPDMDDFGNDIGSRGLNACVAIVHTLNYLISRDPEEIFWVGNAFIETVDSRIMEEDELEDDEVDKHPLMVEARDFLLKETAGNG